VCLPFRWPEITQPEERRAHAAIPQSKLSEVLRISYRDF
jgi:hypothetical protein